MATNPFKVGYHIKDDEDRRTPGPVKDQDGYISAIQTFLFLVALGVGLSYAHTMTLKIQTKHVTKIAVEAILNLYMISAMGVILAFWRSSRLAHLHVKNDSRSADDTASTTHDSHQSQIAFQKNIEDVLPVIGIVGFYILGAALDILKIVAQTMCLVQYLKCGKFVLLTYVMSMTFHGIRLVFMGLVMVFCYVFHSRVMQRCATVRYGLLLITAASVVIWFDCTLYDSNGLFNEDDSIVNNRSCRIPHQNNNESAKFHQCLTETTSLYNMTNAWFPFLYPINIEFLLLAIEMLMHLFSTTESAGKLLARKKRWQGERRRRLLYDATGTTSVQTQTSQRHDTLTDSYENTAVKRRIPKKQSEVDSEVEETKRGVIFEGECDVHTTEPPLDHRAETQPKQIAENNHPSTTNSPDGLDIDAHISEVDDATPSSQQNADDAAPGRCLCFPCCENLGCFSRCTHQGIDSGERQRLLHDVTDDVTANSFARPDHVPTTGPTFFFISFILNIIVVTFGVLTYDTNDINIWLYAYGTLKILYWIPGIVVCVLSFKASKNFESNFTNFTGLEMMVIVSVFGFMLQAVFTIASVFGMLFGTQQIVKNTMMPLIPDGLPWIILIDQILDLIQMFTQTNFMVHASNVIPRTDDTREAARARRTFRNALIYLIMCNFVLWITNSFIEMKNISLAPVQALFYRQSEWHLITHLLMPFSLFYRFNCFIIFSKIFLHQK